MEIVANVTGGIITVRIRDGTIYEVSCEESSYTKTFSRGKSREIQWRLGRIFKNDFEKFEEILNNIGEKDPYFTYCKWLMEAEKERWDGKLKEHLQRSEKKAAELQKKIDKYTWPK